MKLSVVNQLNLTILGLLFLLLGSGVVNYAGLAQLNNATNEAQSSNLPIILSKDLAFEVLEFTSSLDQLLINDDPTLHQSLADTLNMNGDQMHRVLDQLSQHSRGDNALTAQVMTVRDIIEPLLSAVDTLEPQIAVQVRLKNELLQLNQLIATLASNKYALLHAAYLTEDTFIQRMAEKALATLGAFESRANQAFRSADPSVTERTMATNERLYKVLQNQLDDAISELPEQDQFGNTANYSLITDPIMNFADQVSDDDGLLARHKQMLEVSIEIERTRTTASSLREQLNQQLSEISTAARSSQQLALGSMSGSKNLLNSTLFGAAAAALLAGALLSLALNRRVRREIRHVQQVLAVVAEGDLTRRADEGNDEFGQIGQSVNTVSNKLQLLLTDLVHSASGMKELSHRNREISDQSQHALRQQTGEVENVVAAITEMEASFQEVSHSAQNAQNSVEALNHQVAGAYNKMQDNIQTAETLTRQIDRSVAASGRLNQASEDIGQILQVISAIAEQTNLLALNAAIEAARAGEHGRGFAVVADEVRSLAGRTGESVEEVESLIERLQSDTQAVSKAMHTNSEQIQTNVEQVQQVSAAMEQTRTLLQDISSQSLQINEATNEQAATASQVSRRVHAISSLSQASLRNIESLATLGLELESLSEEQSNASRQFKLN